MKESTNEAKGMAKVSKQLCEKDIFNNCYLVSILDVVGNQAGYCFSMEIFMKESLKMMNFMVKVRI